MFQLYYSHYQAYVQSLVELYMLNAYAVGSHTAYVFYIHVYSSTSDCG
jgi:hypothetical protein